jgi:hypothetical protein
MQLDFEAEAHRIVRAIRGSSLDDERLIFALMDELQVFVSHGSEEPRPMSEAERASYYRRFDEWSKERVCEK